MNELLISKGLPFIGLLAGVGMMYTGFSKVTKKKQQKLCKELPDYAKPFSKLISEDSVKVLLLDPLWYDLCDRASEYSAIAKDEFADLLQACANVVGFQVMASLKDYTKGTPRLYRTKLHAVIEAVREMRAEIEENCSLTTLDEFDEVAADIQSTHDDYALNMLLDSTQ